MNKLSVIILNLDDNPKLNDLLSYINSKFVNPEIIVASLKKHDIKESEYIFKKNDAEKIINTLIPKVCGDKLLLIRAFDDKFENLDKLVCAIESKNQISIFANNKKQNKFVNKFMSLLFGYNLYNGSISQICFGFNPLMLLKSFDNCSMYTKIDKWAGYEVVEVPCENYIKLKFKTDNKRSYIKLAVFALTLILPIVAWSLVPFIQKTSYMKAMFIFIVLLSLCLLTIEISIIVVKKFVGNNEYDKIDFEKGEK